MAVQETQVQPLGWEDPLEKGIATTPVFLPGESHGQRRLADYSPWRCKESDMIEWLTLFFFFFTAMIRICTPSGLPRRLSGKESACQCRETGDKSSIWVGKIPWKGKGNPLQYSCLENPMEEPGRPQSIGSQRVRHN